MIRPTTSITPNETILILDNLRSAANVGSLFRTADACGISRIILVGTTPCPLDRFGRIAGAQKEIAKVALGAEQTIPWEHTATITSVFNTLKKTARTKIIALEQHSRSVDYKTLTRAHFISQPVAIIIGNEPNGISSQTLKKVDTIAEIKMKGKKESFNVSVAAGIFLAHFMGL